jgi:DNA-binding ferritin-like protein
MSTLLIILGVIGVAVATYLVLLYTGKIKDRDGDFIPDVVEDTVEDIKEDVAEVKSEVKRRVKRVKEELKDVKAAGKNLAKQSKDVVEAARGGNRKGRKPSNRKRNATKK